MPPTPCRRARSAGLFNKSSGLGPGSTCGGALTKHKQQSRAPATQPNRARATEFGRHVVINHSAQRAGRRPAAVIPTRRKTCATPGGCSGKASQREPPDKQSQQQQRQEPPRRRSPYASRGPPYPSRAARVGLAGDRRVAGRRTQAGIHRTQAALRRWIPQATSANGASVSEAAAAANRSVPTRS